MLIIDGHVHLHALDNTAQLFDAASDHFSSISLAMNLSEAQGVLLLAETQQSTCVRQLSEWARKHKKINGKVCWQLLPTSEPYSFKAHGDEMNLICICGNQYVSQENIELLVFGLPGTVESGSIKAMIEQAGQDSLIILPWGVGKWLGRRGKIISNLICRDLPSNILLGDNGGRPWAWKRVRQFTEASKKGMKILRGSDPLPMVGDGCRAGSFGSICTGTIDMDYPGASVVRLLCRQRGTCHDYGRLLPMLSFFKSQIMLRLKKK